MSNRNFTKRSTAFLKVTFSNYYFLNRTFKNWFYNQTDSKCCQHICILRVAIKFKFTQEVKYSLAQNQETKKG
jgi:hypothetical protein